jgi:hypothetical protein
MTKVAAIENKEKCDQDVMKVRARKPKQKKKRK